MKNALLSNLYIWIVIVTVFVVLFAGFAGIIIFSAVTYPLQFIIGFIVCFIFIGIYHIASHFHKLYLDEMR